MLPCSGESKLMAERKPRVIEGHCAECTLRIERRELVGGGFQEGPTETTPKCLHGDYRNCPSYRRAMSALAILLLRQSSKQT